MKVFHIILFSLLNLAFIFAQDTATAASPVKTEAGPVAPVAAANASEALIVPAYATPAPLPATGLPWFGASIGSLLIDPVVDKTKSPAPAPAAEAASIPVVKSSHPPATGSDAPALAAEAANPSIPPLPAVEGSNATETGSAAPALSSGTAGSSLPPIRIVGSSLPPFDGSLASALANGLIGSSLPPVAVTESSNAPAIGAAAPIPELPAIASSDNSTNPAVVPESSSGASESEGKVEEVTVATGIISGGLGAAGTPPVIETKEASKAPVGGEGVVVEVAGSSAAPIVVEPVDTAPVRAPFSLPGMPAAQAAVSVPPTGAVVVELSQTTPEPVIESVNTFNVQPEKEIKPSAPPAEAVTYPEEETTENPASVGFEAVPPAVPESPGNAVNPVRDDAPVSEATSPKSTWPTDGYSKATGYTTKSTPIDLLEANSEKMTSPKSTWSPENVTAEMRPELMIAIQPTDKPVGAPKKPKVAITDGLGAERIMHGISPAYFIRNVSTGAKHAFYNILWNSNLTLNERNTTLRKWGETNGIKDAVVQWEVNSGKMMKDLGDNITSLLDEANQMNEDMFAIMNNGNITVQDLKDTFATLKEENPLAFEIHRFIKRRLFEIYA